MCIYDLRLTLALSSCRVLFHASLALNRIWLENNCIAQVAKYAQCASSHFPLLGDPTSFLSVCRFQDFRLFLSVRVHNVFVVLWYLLLMCGAEDKAGKPHNTQWHRAIVQRMNIGISNKVRVVWDPLHPTAYTSSRKSVNPHYHT